MMDEVGCLVMGKSSNLGGLMRKMIRVTIVKQEKMKGKGKEENGERI